jgi:uncharacterized protein YndB with AHSA1/START domain
MPKNLVAKSSITVNAPPTKVWSALVTPAAIKQYMFGTNVTTSWKEGSPIVWKGEWQGKAYEDKGVIRQFKPERTLEYTHFSPLAGLPDKPENYHTVTVQLSPEGTQTRVTLSQDNNADEKEREHSEKNWTMMLGGLKKFVEG